MKRSRPDLVVVADRAEGEQTCDFRREFAFRLRVAAEISRGAHVHHQHHSQLAFFGEFFDERRPEPRGHVPIDRANFVAGLIFAHLIEVHPASFEDAVVIAGENRLHQTLGLDFERADLLQNLRGCLFASHGLHHGTGRPAKIRSMIVSLEIVSASAS